jgi:hypothetical protein
MVEILKHHANNPRGLKVGSETMTRIFLLPIKFSDTLTLFFLIELLKLHRPPSSFGAAIYSLNPFNN